MSRFILTNNELKFNSGRNNFINADLIPVNSPIKNKFNFQSFKRNDKKENNIIQFDNGDFISVIGTMIYNNKIGTKCYESVYNSYDGDCRKIQNYADGNYCIILYKNNKLSIFCDKYNLYNVYYYFINEEYYISNSLDSVCRSLDKKTLRLSPLIEAALQRGIMDKEMFYKNVFKLVGYESILIKKNNFIIKEFKHTKKFYESSNKKDKLSQIADKLSKILINNAKLIGKLFNNEISILATGGMDSRLITASFLNIGIKPKLLYGIGNSAIMNTFDQDKDIVIEQAKAFNLEYELLDWSSEGFENESKTIYYFKKYGFNYVSSHCNFNRFLDYEKTISKFSKLSTHGLFGENLKIRSWAVNKNKNYLSLNEIIEEYHIPKFFPWKSQDLYNKYVKNIKKSLIELCSIYQIPIKDNEYVKMNDFEELRTLFSRPNDGIEANLINEFMYFLYPLFMTDTYEFGMSIPWKQKYQQKIGLNVLKKLSPKITKIPIFTHSENHDIINDALIKRMSKNKILKERLKPFIPNFILKIRRNVIINNKKEVKDRDKITAYYRNKLKNHNLIKDIFDLEKKYTYDVRTLIMLYLYIIGVDDIGYDNVCFE